MSFSETIAVDNGAKFYRADLHIHSYGPNGSSDVDDVNMVPEKIIEEAVKENLSVISITDHNEIGNIQAAVAYAKDKNILVIPGVELSTSQGHLLVYFETYEQIRSFIGELKFSSDKKQCDSTITAALDIAGKYQGFGVAAHVDIDAGFENYLSGYNPFKEAILKHELLYGLEISNKAAIDWYTELDGSADRRRLFSLRKQVLNQDNSHNLAKIMSSDAHKLVAFGKNLAGNKKLTRVKLDQLNFNSLRVAFLDPNARIKIEEVIPKTYPKFIGIEFEGGILGSNRIHFSPNFNSIIGGRGTGKSTLLESIRTGSGNISKTELIDSEVWSNTLKLYYEDEAGRVIEFHKQKTQPLVNMTDSSNGVTRIPIESFGQGETADIIHQSGKDPAALLKFIDSFIDVERYEIEDERIRTELLTNQILLERLVMDVNRIPDIERAFNNAKAQLATLKANNAKEVVEREEAIARERILRDRLLQNLDSHLQGITKSLDTEALKGVLASIPENEIIVGKSEYTSVSQLMSVYTSGIESQSQTVTTSSSEFRVKVQAIVDSWKAKEVEIIREIDSKRVELEKQGIKLDIDFIRKVTKDVTDYEVTLSGLRLKEKTHSEERAARTKLLVARSTNLDKLHTERLRFIYEANQSLKGSIIDFEVEIRLDRQTFSPEACEVIKTAMGYRTAQVPKADFLVRSLSYFPLLKAILRNDKGGLTSLLSEGQQIFDDNEASHILAILKDPRISFQLERVRISDWPHIRIVKVITNKDGSKEVVEREFGKLSMGQQQSILLNLLLLSKRNCPLIIDQPEDNLDSEFIYKTLVTNLKRIKENRQVIIVTHNANIAVLGDSELILPLKSTNDKTYIISRGSIDSVETNKMACRILEGGEIAFKKRQAIYNL